MKDHEEYMREAIDLSVESVAEGGGPFGAIIVDVKTGEVVGRGKNRVVINNDPVAHGEIEAIRNACKNINGTNLVGCVLYTSAEPCPGCLVETLFNAGIKDIYYGNSVEDAANVGFADDKNWAIIQASAQEIMQKAGGTLTQILSHEAQRGFKAWQEKKNRIDYYQA
jgi:tRNA(Arg) A34 adenosine deaminase TadA